MTENEQNELADGGAADCLSPGGPGTENEAAGGQSRAGEVGANLTAVLGAAVIVRGVVVAWFADFDEAAEEWCTENHFGQWLIWRAKRPEIVPLTPDEMAKVEAEAARLAELFEESPNAN